MRICLFGICVCLIGATSVAAAEPNELQQRIDARFAQATTESPDFQRHLVPMLSKLGCNGRACHGSFQGRGGFQLSLFGYDFAMDHAGLSERIDTDDPADSYALQKALQEVEHEGGQRIQPDSWEHRVFSNWIANGAKRADENVKLDRLEITPQEIVFADAGQTEQLTVIAVWQDGTREDVTPLSRFQSNDTSIVEVDQSGIVKAGTAGDSHVVVFYDNGTVPIPVLQPISREIASDYPDVATPTKVDALVVEKLRKLGIVPAETCSDSDFLRRVTIDITGTLPTPDQVTKFLADSTSDKRARKIDELLETPAYSAWWATRLNDYTGNSSNQLNNVSYSRTQPTQEWYEWIRSRVADNVPYDQIVRGIVVANSQQPGESYQEFCERMTEAFKDSSGQKFAQRDSMPYYWARRNFQTAEDRAIGFAYTFLGIRIQCAQCHKHPFDQWTQDDFKEFQPLFATTRFSRNGPSKKDYEAVIAALDVDKQLKGNQQRNEFAKLIKQGEVVPFPTLNQTPPRRARNKKNSKSSPTQARLLGGDPFDMNQFADPREPIMNWLTGDAEQLFAKAFVNRVWANYFHRGIVEPTDDLSLANPPVNQALLDHLTQGFLDHNYDMKWLHREICNSRTYQLSWQPNQSNRLDERNFSRAVPRRIPAEVAYDAISQATAGSKKNSLFLTDLNKRATAVPGSAQGRRGNNYALTIFGKSARENNCDCERSAEPTLLQTLFLFNDDELLNKIDDRNGWLAENAKAWNVSFAGVNTANNNEQPKNFAATVKRYRELIAKIDREKKPQQFEKQTARLKAYIAKYGQPAEVAPEPADNSTAATGSKLKDVVEQSYLRTLSRMPTEQEMQVSLQAFNEVDTPVEGLRDLLWALLNTKEFLINH